MAHPDLALTHLGKSSAYIDTYTPSLLQRISRTETRTPTGLAPENMVGEDVWTGYEFSWIDLKGKPHVCGVRLRVSCQSPAIVESKSMKLYLLSFSQTKFENRTEVLKTLDQDLSMAFVRSYPPTG